MHTCSPEEQQSQHEWLEYFKKAKFIFMCTLMWKDVFTLADVGLNRRGAKVCRGCFFGSQLPESPIWDDQQPWWMALLKSALLQTLIKEASSSWHLGVRCPHYAWTTSHPCIFAIFTSRNLKWDKREEKQVIICHFQSSASPPWWWCRTGKRRWLLPPQLHVCYNACYQVSSSLWWPFLEFSG